MSYLFIALVLLHSIIHVLGFLKAFNICKIDDIKMDVSKVSGVFWLLSFLLGVFLCLAYYLNFSLWPFLAILFVIISQSVIIAHWRESKFGTIPNVIILVVAITGVLQFNFNKSIEQDILLIKSDKQEQNRLTQNTIEDLPDIVWIPQAVNSDYITFVETDDSLSVIGMMEYEATKGE